MFYRRHLPHWIPESAVLFVTWRLAGSRPPVAPERLTAANTGRSAFYQNDAALDRWRGGPLWLEDPRVANLLAGALRYGEAKQFYTLHAWVIMPNHVHLLIEPQIEFPRIMRWLKGTTARRANRILGRSGLPFWQVESYDHWVRSPEELQELIHYIEENPINAGLVRSVEQWPWSSASADDKKRSSALRV